MADVCFNPRKTVRVGTDWILVPCGKCPACRRRKAREWALRLAAENCQHNESVFVTLTYDDEHIPNNGSLCIRDYQLFLKRLRKRFSFRYFLCGEYGETTERPHYHAILFGVGLDKEKDISSAWSLGHVQVRSVVPARICYIAGYVEKKYTSSKTDDYFQVRGLEPEFHRMSLRPGIGDDYFKKNRLSLDKCGYDVLFGRRVPLSGFFKRKYSSDEAKKRRIKGAVDLLDRRNKMFMDDYILKGRCTDKFFDDHLKQCQWNEKARQERRKKRDVVA